eukprot:scaffold106115_cov66-Phaeocystis_antarctica.AAC.3
MACATAHMAPRARDTNHAPEAVRLGGVLCERCRNHLEVGKGVINPEHPDSAKKSALFERADDLVMVLGLQ